MDARSRRVPAAALDDSASIRSRAYYNPSHQLRPAESRFSLREQFAATRREIDFGFDDASSVLERSTLASEMIRGDGYNDAIVVGTEPSPAFLDSNSVYRDCYELLCLPKGVSLSPEQVRDAAHRLIQVLAVDRQSPSLQSPAAFYLGLVQAAFETLVEPSKRLGYDLSGAGEEDSDCDVAAIDEDIPYSASNGTYESRLQEQYLLLTHRDARASTDIGLRVDAASLLASPLRVSRRHGSGFDILDFSIRKSTTTSVPALRGPIERTALFLQGVVNKDLPGAQAGHSLYLTDPTVTITGSTHGLLDESFKLAPLLLGRYQPPGPSIHGQRRIEQLLASRFLPTLNLNVCQEFFWREDARTRALPDLVVEQELELLPQPSMTTRIGHSIDLPGSCEPVNVEICAQKLINHTRGVAPSLGLAVHRRAGPGTAFLVADGGNWNIWPSKECRELSQFSKISGGFTPMLEAFRNPPTLEAGYSFGRHDLGIQSGQAFTKPPERGLAAIDCDLDENKAGSWTVSTGLTPGNAAAYLRYGKNLLSSLTPSTTPRQKKTGVRAEIELSSTVQRDFFLAFRALKRIGRFSKAGLEVGISPTNLHLSLYWSRLGQRISLPFLVATTKARFSTKLLFWTTVFPFATLAAWELYQQRQQRLKAAAAAKSLASILNREKKLHEYITRRRAEADELTVVLATGVEPRQAAERQRGGLVIVSAKYGVRDAPPDEVADVTIAVAALVDGEGRLVIPGGLRKSRLLGFWDPAPMGTKVLRVRYLWRGEERAVEVCGRGELRLP